MLLLLAGLTLGLGQLAECGPTVSPDTTRAIIQVESGGNPFAIGDNTQKKSFAPKSAAEAVELAGKLIAQGHNVDLGLMQINSQHIPAMKLTLEELFDPCQNIRIGTTILSDFYRQHKTEDPAQSLFRALSAYNTGRSWKGTGYINRILQAAGVEYRVTAPEGTTNPKQSARDAAVSSPLFFDNLSSSMRPQSSF